MCLFFELILSPLLRLHPASEITPEAFQIQIIFRTKDVFEHVIFELMTGVRTPFLFDVIYANSLSRKLLFDSFTTLRQGSK